MTALPSNSSWRSGPHYLVSSRLDSADYPGLVIAGEYPGAPDPEAARARVRAHLAAGVRTFVDLTEEGELAPYAGLVAHEAARLGVEAAHVRVPIRDVDVPSSPDVTARALDVVEAAAADRPAVYVHCWGGVGRTGTVVGCLLRRRGMGGDRALAETARLYATVEKAARRPESPETEAQRAYVRDWAEPAAGPGDRPPSETGRASGYVGG